jgi:alkyl hydroperoxide reductase subunit F
MYELAIIGGGPAGVAAGVYAARKQLKTVFIAEELGGQSNVSEGIQNWIGTVEIPGIKFAEVLEAHLRAYSDGIVDIKKGERVELISKSGDFFEVKTNNGSYKAKAVLAAAGAHRRKLTIPGAQEFENKGITYCASCDGPLFSGKDVMVVGGGNAGFETAAQLLSYVKSVILLHRHNEFKADPVTVEKVLSNPKMKAVKNAEPVEVGGDKFVASVVYEDVGTKERTEVLVEGVFAEIGLIPNTDFVKNLLELTQYGQIKIDPKTQRASADGVWAAGDCTDALYHQNNIAAGDAVRALEDIYLYLRAK